MSNNEKQPLVQVKDVCKYFHVGKNADLKAVDHVSFEIYKGETVGLVGESGCGKSTMGRCMIRLYDPTSGEVIYDGKNITKLTAAEKREFCQKVQMIFQNPYASLNSRMTVKEIVGEGLREHGMSGKDADVKVQELLEIVGLNKDHMSRFPHEFSGGQRQRIGIARALALKPKFVVCDEAVSALDVSIQSQIVNLLKDLGEKENLAYLFISHGLSVVKYISDRIGVMYLGNIVELASSQNMFDHPMHPYTEALLSAIPTTDPDAKKEIVPLEGDIPSPVHPPKGCKFHTRCKYCQEICKHVTPELRELEPEHYVACHFAEKLG